MKTRRIGILNRIFCVVLLLVPPGSATTALAQAASVQLSDVSVATQPDTVTVYVKTSGTALYTADLIDSPDRLVVDFANTTYGWRKTPLKVGSEPLKQIRGSQYRKDTARLVVELSRKVGYAIREDDDGLSIIIPSGDPTARGAAATVKKVVATKADKPATSAKVDNAAPADNPAETTDKTPLPAAKTDTPAPADATDKAVAQVATPDKPVPPAAKADKPVRTAAKRDKPAVAESAKAVSVPDKTTPPAGSALAVAAPASIAPTTGPVVRIAQASTAPAKPAAPASAVVPAPSMAEPQRLISLDFKDADVVNLLRILAAESTRNIVIGEDVKGKMSISLRNVPWELALDTILESKGLTKLDRDGVMRIVSQEQLAKEREAKARVEEAKVKSETDIRTKIAEAQLKEQEAQARRIAADAATAEQIARGPLREETIRLSYADPEDVAKTLQGILGITDQGAPSSAAPIPAGPGVIPAPPFSQLFGPGAPPPPPVVSPSADVLAKGITIRAHKPTNSVFIRHYEADLQRIKKLITEKLDIPLPQVKIEARMEILARQDLFAIGVQWGGGGVAFNNNSTVVGRGFTSSQPTSGGIAPGHFGPGSFANSNLAATSPSGTTLTSALPVSATSGLPAGGNVVNLPIGALLGGAAAAGTGGLAFGIIGSHLNLNLALEALKTEGKTRTLARPEVVTVENAKAAISLGEEIPYATVSSAGTQIQFKEALLKLEVTPTVVREPENVNRIKMKVLVENNSRSTTTIDLGSAGSPPVIVRRKAETEVMIREGERLVIGGVTNNEVTEEVRKIPMFGDIPLLGWLFKQTGEQNNATELVIFITPSIVRRDTTASVIAPAIVPKR
jgi:type IV pilus secretin PilQ/predicted competence protein